MTKLKKVIKGLECCRAQLSSPLCEECPYKDDVQGTCDTLNNIFSDALELLKAQEPRVLTLEEAANRLKEPVFLEWKTKRRQSYTGWVLVYDVQKGMGITGVRMGLTQPGHITSWYPIDLYGLKWRCWSAKPSDDQMDGTPWEK